MSTLTVTPKRRRRVFYGWWIALSAAVVHFYCGGSFYYGFTSFFTPIRASFNWSYTATSLAFVLQRLEGGVLAPVAGYLVDKVGPRRMMLAGLGLAGLGFLVFSRINSLLTFYGAFMVVAMGMSLGVFSATTTAVANWFSRLRGRALAVSNFGFGAAGLFVPLLVWLIDTYGWRRTLVALGVTLWVAILPLALVMRHKPEQYGQLPDGETPEELEQRLRLRVGGNPSGRDRAGAPAAQEFDGRAALATSAFWLISVAFLFQHIGTSAIMVHIMPHLEGEGFSRNVAGLAVTGMTLTSIVGRVAFGTLADFFNKRYILAAAFGLQAIGTVALAYARTPLMLVVFLLTYGPGYGGPVPVRPALQADYFGRTRFGTIHGLFGAVGMIGGLVSPVFAGWVKDTTGGYHQAFLIIAAVTLPAVVAILLARAPRRRDGPSAGERPEVAAAPGVHEGGA